MAAIIGLDFGTESVRALLLDGERGEVIGSAARAYAHGVIDIAMPDGGDMLPPDWALQHPTDWLLSMVDAVGAVMAETRYPPTDVAGLGIDFTSCTILPVTGIGEPLCLNPAMAKEPHAWPKLWKHHAAQTQADRINALAVGRDEHWIKRYGGRVSSEWLLPKALQVFDEAPEIYAAAEYFIEAGDWIVWQLTGVLARNSCAAGYKALWHREDGYPAVPFLEALEPGIADLYRAKLSGAVVAPGTAIGPILPSWCDRMGLIGDVKVAAPIIDAHAAAIGGATSLAGDLFMIMGTSTCHMLLGESEEHVPGIAGVVEDGIVGGLFGYEAGQAASGDVLAWFVDKMVPVSYSREAVRQGLAVHDYLSALCANQLPGESGLIALDWFNGNRSTLVDAELSGLVLGITLGTRPEEIYRALIEATAFGTRVIVDAFEDAGLPVRTVRAGGTLAGNEVIAQIYADVLGRQIAVVDASGVSARGAAILGASASGLFPSVAAATAELGTRLARTFFPHPNAQKTYDELYAEYKQLYDHFGRGANDVMKRLRVLKRSNKSE